jgi:hypothetical protein
MSLESLGLNLCGDNVLDLYVTSCPLIYSYDYILDLYLGLLIVMSIFILLVLLKTHIISYEPGNKSLESYISLLKYYIPILLSIIGGLSSEQNDILLIISSSFTILLLSLYFSTFFTDKFNYLLKGYYDIFFWLFRFCFTPTINSILLIIGLISGGIQVLFGNMYHLTLWNSNKDNKYRLFFIQSFIDNSLRILITITSVSANLWWFISVNSLWYLLLGYIILKHRRIFLIPILFLSIGTLVSKIVFPDSLLYRTYVVFALLSVMGIGLHLRKLRKNNV